MTGPASDPFGTAVGDWVAGRRAPLHLRTRRGVRLEHDLGAYFAPLSAPERWLLGLAGGLVVDVGCGPARHARFLQARGLRAVGIDRSALALATATALGLRLAVQADALHGPLPAGFGTALLLDGNLGIGGTALGAARLLDRLAGSAGDGARLLVSGRAPRGPAHRTWVLRGEYLGTAGPWFDWLVPSLAGLTALAATAGWRREHALAVGTRYWASFRLDHRSEQ